MENIEIALPLGGTLMMDEEAASIVAQIKNALEIIDQVCETTAGWPKLAKNCAVPQKMIDGIVPHMLLSI